MKSSLEEAKKNLVSRYLGKFGIHGVGIRKADNVLCIYFNRDAEPEVSILKEIEDAAAPFKIVAIKEERPIIS